MAESIKNVAAGLDSAGNTIGLNGLSPLEVIAVAPLELRPTSGTLRIHIDLAPGDALAPGRPIAIRIFGGEAGLEFDGNGQIVQLNDTRLPLEIAYRRRAIPEPPPRGQFSVDLSFWHGTGAGWVAQDLQWRVPITWAKRGGNVVELRYTAA